MGEVLNHPRLEDLCASLLGCVPKGGQIFICLDRGDGLLPEHVPEILGSHILFEAPGGVAKDIGPERLTHFIGRYLLTYIPQPNDACSVGQHGDLVENAKFIELHPGHVRRMVL